MSNSENLRQPEEPRDSTVQEVWTDEDERELDEQVRGLFVRMFRDMLYLDDLFETGQLVTEADLEGVDFEDDTPLHSSEELSERAAQIVGDIFEAREWEAGRD